MKKIFLALAAAVLSAGMVSAQDLATATETYNSGAEQLQLGDKAAALGLFKQALEMGESLGDEAVDLVANCKKTIPTLMLSISKDALRNKEYEDAIVKLGEVVETAKAYENEEVAEEASTLIPQAYMSAGTAALSAKNMEAAVANLRKAVELDPTNGNAALRLGQALSATNDLAGAKEAFQIALANGQEATAKKQLGNIILKEAQAALKANKFADVVTLVNQAEADDLITNAAAYQLAASASTKLNKTADAIKFYEKFLEADPTNKNAGAIAYTVGALYQQQNNKAKALEFYKKAVAAGYADAQKMVDTLSK